VQPTLVLDELDSVVTRHWLKGLQVAAPDRAEDRVVREAGTVRDLARRKDLPDGAAHRRQRC
jgi:hypothetical protein